MLTQPLIQLIQTHTGLRIQAQNTAALTQVVQGRMKVLKFTTVDQYYQHLIKGISLGNPHFSQFGQEWQHLIQPLIIGESYFLRDQGQFRLLEKKILPELIQQRRQLAKVHHTKPTLGIWSAGCSTGEEPYSLAMLVQQLLPDWHAWDLRIVGTDINPDAIAWAKRGTYDSWSFRSMDVKKQSQYFQVHRGQWNLDEKIRNMVTFQPGNLVQDPFPDMRFGLYDMDLIVCRNVFIYFALESIEIVIEKFAKTLSPWGYLITGHTELHNQKLAGLRTKVYPESVVYQRLEEGQLGGQANASLSFLLPPLSASNSVTPPKKEASLPRQTANSTPAQNSLTQNQELVEQVKRCFHRGDYAGVVALSEDVTAHNPPSFELHQLMAQAYLNLGAYERAKYYAQKTAEIHTLSTAPYYLLAYIAREQKQCEQAKDLLKRIIYLEPTAITAYLELSSLYTQEGNIQKAQKMKETALALMEDSSKE